MTQTHTLLVAILITFTTAFSFPFNESEWGVVFYDEFNTTELDLTKWTAKYPNHFPNNGYSHNHEGWIDESQTTVADGKLTLTAIAEKHPASSDGTGEWDHQFGWIPFNYTSGAVNTKGKFEFTQGYVEARLKVPPQRGTWPAFWTLNGDGGWPPEIDILEVPQDRRSLHTYYHYGDWQNSDSFGGEYWHWEDLSNGYHTYAVMWGDNYMDFYFDDQIIFQSHERWEISDARNMYLILNLAVGGWANDPVASNFPANYDCDWVRVWQKDATDIRPEDWDPDAILIPSSDDSTPESSESNVEESILTITSKTTSHRLTINNAGDLVQVIDSDGTKWTTITSADGDVQLKKFGTTLCIDVAGESEDDGAPIGGWECKNKYSQYSLDNQLFTFIEHDDGYYSIVQKHSQKCLGLGNSTEVGSAISQYTCDNSDSQLWEISGIVINNDESSDLSMSSDESSEVQSSIESSDIVAPLNSSPESSPVQLSSNYSSSDAVAAINNLEIGNVTIYGTLSNLEINVSHPGEHTVSIYTANGALVHSGRYNSSSISIPSKFEQKLYYVHIKNAIVSENKVFFPVN